MKTHTIFRTAESYAAPAVERIAVAVEHGFASSPAGGGASLPGFDYKDGFEF